MARARNIKPGFYKNEDLAECSVWARYLFPGLWMLADREGRLEDRPRRIRMELLPFDTEDVEPLLDELEQRKFITRYEIDGKRCIQICAFVRHQNPHHMELPSELPPPPGLVNVFNHHPVTKEQRERIFLRDGKQCVACKAKSRLCIDHILSRVQGGTSDDDNLQTLCSRCNSKKGSKGSNESRTNRERIENESTSIEERSLHTRLIALNPSSLNPSSLNPSSLNPSSLNPELNPLSGSPPDAISAKQEKLNGYKQQAAEILTFLNEKTGHKYKPVAATLKPIIARLREGFVPDDLRAVVAAKCRQWAGNEKMNEYLRPKTLFGAENFANYEGRLGP